MSEAEREYTAPNDTPYYSIQEVVDWASVRGGHAACAAAIIKQQQKLVSEYEDRLKTALDERDAFREAVDAFCDAALKGETPGADLAERE